MDTTFNPADVAAFEHATWSRCAPGYRSGFAALTGQAIDELLDAARVDSGSRLLDVGTGIADLAAAASDRGATVSAIDFSEAMVAEARRSHTDLDVRLASADSLPFAEGSFDAVIANCVLHHLADPHQALTEAHRVLVDGGPIACTIWAPPDTLEAFGLFFSAVAQHANVPDLPHGPLFGVTDADTLEALFDGAGFQGFGIERLETAWPMASIDTLLKAFGAWADLDAVPTATRSAIEGTVREHASAYQTDDGLLIPNPMLIITASANPATRPSTD